MYKVMPLPSTRKVPSVPRWSCPPALLPAAATAEPAEDDLLDTAAPAELAAEDALLDAAEPGNSMGPWNWLHWRTRMLDGVEDELRLDQHRRTRQHRRRDSDGPVAVSRSEHANSLRLCVGQIATAAFCPTFGRTTPVLGMVQRFARLA